MMELILIVVAIVLWFVSFIVNDHTKSLLRALTLLAVLFSIVFGCSFMLFEMGVI